MPVSAVSFGEWLNDLPAPPRGPGSQSEATGHRSDSARPGDFGERLVFVVRLPRAPPAPLVTAGHCLSVLHTLSPPPCVSSRLWGALGLPGHPGTEGASAMLALQWTLGLAFGWARWALFRFPGLGQSPGGSQLTLGWFLDRPVASALTKETRTRSVHRSPEAQGLRTPGRP